MKASPVVVPVAVEAKKGADGKPEFVFVERIGRFGWKCQEASLLNFSAGAYLNEMGITSPLQPKENLSNGRDVSKYDKVADPEDKLVDPKRSETKRSTRSATTSKSFTRFMRSTKAPPRDSPLAGTDGRARKARSSSGITRPSAAPSATTPTTPRPAAGTPIKTLDRQARQRHGHRAEALGDKIIHPYSDFMLHDIGTGDGIAQTQHADLPPRGMENLEKIPEDIKSREGICGSTPPWTGRSAGP